MLPELTPGRRLRAPPSVQAAGPAQPSVGGVGGAVLGLQVTLLGGPARRLVAKTRAQDAVPAAGQTRERPAWWRPRPAGSTAGPQTPDLESAGEELLQGRGALRVRRPSNRFRGTQGVRVVVARLPQRPSPGHQAWGSWGGGFWVRAPREDISEALQVAMPCPPLDRSRDG